MKQLLMILDHFPPSFAPRMGYLAKYLKDMGWEAVALSMPHPTRDTGMEFLEGNIESIVVKPKSLKKSKLSTLSNELYGLTKARPLWSRNDETMYRRAKEICNTRRFDAILCSTSSFHPLYCASRLAEELNIPLLADLRDIYEQDDNLQSNNALSALLHKRQIAKRNKLLAKASAVTTVSSWHKDFLSQFNPNTTLIFNGFDESMFSFPQPQETDKFTITYTGSIRLHKNHTQSPEMLFEAIADLVEKGVIEKDKIALRFYSDNPSLAFVKQLVSKFNFPSAAELHDWTAAEQIPEILAQSNVLLLLLSEENTHGIVTTKLFEYMASNREILCIPNSGGEIENIINQANAGCCIDKYPELLNYLKFKYNEWQKKHFVEPHTERNFVSAFSRERQAMQFVNILNNIIKTNNL